MSEASCCIQSQDQEKTWTYAKKSVYQYLKYRMRSEHEIREKLKTKGLAPQIITQTVCYFQNLGLIDDRQFAQAWIRSRLKKPYGIRRIAFELAAKGISKMVIAEETAKAAEDFPENETVQNLAIRYAAKNKDVEPSIMNQRVYGYLSRRGFNRDAIQNAIRQL